MSQQSSSLLPFYVAKLISEKNNKLYDVSKANLKKYIFVISKNIHHLQDPILSKPH